MVILPAWPNVGAKNYYLEINYKNRDPLVGQIGWVLLIYIMDKVKKLTRQKFSINLFSSCKYGGEPSGRIKGAKFDKISYY
jgi:hypothetical protein